MGNIFASPSTRRRTRRKQYLDLAREGLHALAEAVGDGLALPRDTLPRQVLALGVALSALYLHTR